MGQMVQSDWVAWYAAAVATGVFFWDFYKWYSSGSKMRIKIAPSSMIVGNSDFEQGDTKKYTFFYIYNTGDRNITITTIGLVYYQNWFMWLMRRVAKDGHMIIPNFHYTGNRDLPHVVEVGAYWQGGMMQNEEFVKMAQNGVLFGQVWCTYKDKPISKRIKIVTSR